MHTRMLLAATLAVAGFGFTYSAAAQSAAQRTENAAQDAAQRSQNAAEGAAQQAEDAARRTGNALERTGDQLTGANSIAPDAEDIRETLQEVTQAALTRGGFDDLVERFVDADRNRLGQGDFTEQDHPTLNGRVAQLQQEWQAKYNQEFRIPDKEMVYNAAFATIIQSEIGRDARLAGERQPGAPSATATPPGATPGATPPAATPRSDADRVAGGDTNRDPGRNIATVTIAARNGLPEVRVPLIHEFPDQWKIDIPDSYSAQQLHDNLLKQLSALSENKEQWPAEANEAYRMATHRVLLAVMNVNEQGMQPGMQQPGMRQQPGMNQQQPGGMNQQPGSTPQPGGANRPATPGANPQ